MNNPEIYYYGDGQIECVKYINESLGFHREDGPAYITWFPDGIKYYEGYFMNNSAHRVDGPATQYFHTNGNKEFEIYYLNGIKHREDGPAFTLWLRNGNKEREEYWLNGKMIFPKSLEEFKRIVKLMAFK